MHTDKRIALLVIRQYSLLDNIAAPDDDGETRARPARTQDKTDGRNPQYH